MMESIKVDHVIKSITDIKRFIPIIALACLLCFLNFYVIFSIGADQFIDSFIHPTDYFSFVKENNGNERYLVIQKSSNPYFIKINENTFFISDELDIYDCQSVLSSDFTGNNSLIGKIISNYGENTIDFIAFSFWLYCKDSMNPYQLLHGT